MVTASTIARYLICICQEDDELLTNSRLQKLLYYIQGWYLAVHDEPAFNEPLEAWIQGPVEPNVYLEYKEYGERPITKKFEKPDLQDELVEVIVEVLTAYGIDSDDRLELKVCSEGPWIKARDRSSRQYASLEISMESMRTYFQPFADGVWNKNLGGKGGSSAAESI